MNKEISIVIPVLNEEKNIKLLTNKIKKVLKNFKFQIVFVDDSSEDNSKKVLKKLSAQHKFFKPILRNKIRDLTRSCFDGIDKSKYKNILIMDGDMQHDPKYIKKMFEIYDKQKLDLVVGARKLIDKPNEGLSETRRFASIILIKLFSIFDISTNDPMSGFFV